MWAAAPVTSSLWVLADRIKLSRSLTGARRVRSMETRMSSYANTSLYICAGTAPRDAGLVLEYSLGFQVAHQLESLILAQNERWRHA